MIEYYLAINKKNQILPFGAAWMDLEGTMPSEISQTEKEKYHIFHLDMESKEQSTQTK